MARTLPQFGEPAGVTRPRSTASIYEIASLLVALLACGSSGPALGETYEISGVYSQVGQEPLFARKLAVGAFEGEFGNQFSYIIEHSLGDIYIGQEPYFEMVEVADNSGVEAIISGMASAAIDVFEIPETRKRCTEKNDEGKCIKSRTTEIICERYLISVAAGLRAISASEDRIIYSDLKELHREETYCPDRSSTTELPAQIIDFSLRKLGYDFRYDLAPRESVNSVRLSESTVGLSKKNKQALKRAVTLSKTDTRASCSAMLKLSDEQPLHPAILYNSALCNESLGDLDTAIRFYTRAEEISPRSATVASGIARIRNHQNTMEFLAERNAAILVTD